ncbi:MULTISPECIES: HAD family hydrolase [unclassified Curtobacterium]|jgi:HAD superfamily hydrolase (TIGR01509 family)|uniref:HAD family hydrolase n=1 Tax=unclassified Curtobacterium TaxID=257496 RepID=UPI00052AEC57|nr:MULTISPECIES: HAD family hydrolase [unclassified Curtobacterium]AIV39277.1 HAD family hydrolase [Curtobacterium sp. MR_MD2014]MBP1301539.1 HAD superfamily hydrolase (TIGR01509 family) [Curtobacterium sp. 1310]MCM3503701.1 HAD family hydrolase [Curtobacterium sp. ODYSSEY 48 V2]MDB6428529.1 HAD family hydrolase [Curtobacterium sp. 20TX0008]
MPDAPSTAVLFDIDGTLADSNYAHVDAWWRAFRAAGESVDAWRIHRAIGMDSGRLLEELLPDASDEVRDTAKQFHTAYYSEHMPQLRLLPGARELLEAVADAGHAVVLATSAPESELSVLRELLDASAWVTAETSSEDVEQAKPDPGIIQVALDKVGVAADRAVMVGDAMWDVESSGKVGLPCVGVMTGGIGGDELRGAGAAAVYDDAAAVLAAFRAGEGPIAALA